MANACGEYLTVAQVRARFEEDVEDLTDEAILRTVDGLAAYVEDQLGHGFGRTLVAASLAADTVEVTALAIVIGGDTYAFADYTTLGSLVAAANSSGNDYDLELLPNVRFDTPSTLLAVRAQTACGPAYIDRVPLCASGLYVVITGGESHAFLPLALAAVSAVTESGVALTASYYWTVVGDTWLIRKCTPCADDSIRIAHGRWKNTWPGNVLISYQPVYWGRAPGAIQNAMLAAFESKTGIAPMQSENFTGYSYRRAIAPAVGAEDHLSGGVIRRYATKFHP